MSRARRTRSRRTWPQRFLITFNVMAIVACVSMAAGLAYFQYKFQQIPRVELEEVLDEVAAPSEPQNYLLVGTDSAAGLDPDDPVTNGRGGLGILSDTIMVLRVDPESEDAAILSFPRDLWIPIAGGGEQRINTALSVGGPEALINTIQEYFGIPINHYVQVDFLGFRDLVSAIDGVPVYFPNPVRDDHTGLNVPNAGCITLDPVQALAFSRSRHYEEFVDGSWETDPTGDLGRISRQQLFIRLAMQRAIAKGVRNPTTLNSLIDVGITKVTIDDALTPDDFFALGRKFRSFDPEQLQTYSPEVTDGNVGGASVLFLAEADANQQMFDIFRGLGGEAGSETGSVRVQVQNGSGTSGQAGTVAEGMGAAGFNVTGQGDAERFDFAQTTLRYATGSEAAADLVRRTIDGPVVLEEVPAIDGADVILITGQDFAGVRAEPAPPDDQSPTTTEAAAVDPATPDPATPSTTVVGSVPTEAPPDVPCG
jgi:LCP family protein required for cell wall assembly